MLRYLCLIFLTLSCGFSLAEPRDTMAGTVQVQKMVGGLKEPWAIGILPNGTVLITERGGKMLWVSKDGRKEVSGLPTVVAKGQGGLLDVVISRDFDKTREIFLTYAAPMGKGAGTAMAVATLSSDHQSLTRVQELFRMKRASTKGKHFGSRVVEAENGDLFVTIGDHGTPKHAQSMDHYSGKVMRVTREGTIEIHSSGHRNPQGGALDDLGQIWIVEHGPKGGDEINQPKFGLDYGWPVISYGRHYSGLKVGEGTHKVGHEQPMLFWDPSIAPSGMMIYQGDMFPEWQGDIFVGSLKFDMISRSALEMDELSEKERLFQDHYNRIRDIREAPDGSIWFLSVGDNAAYRISR
ncbi:glucose sorbosone dehydrogenase [Amylibacter marinus]|uniref:Glucose sorbosone dehydrogenase n=1 Tax=Amylibacter marinus TaxID=1475483 RepID=A0ABQ5VXW1_9RHOB|nr:PQQ-dependent sugar dehydrogenase [Amylibacter marinus]GLQ36047.1 glucose sorbosone dehydrogenase [Amylibacter marinus]